MHLLVLKYLKPFPSGHCTMLSLQRFTPVHSFLEVFDIMRHKMHNAAYGQKTDVVQLSYMLSVSRSDEQGGCRLSRRQTINDVFSK